MGTEGRGRRARRLAIRLVAALALAAGASGLVLLAHRHPADWPVGPRCTFRSLTGLRCPGCGLTRATHHVLQGRPVEALRLNPLIVAVPLLLAWLGWLLGAMLLRGEVPRMPAPPTPVGWGLLVALLIFWAARVVQDLAAGRPGG